MAKFILGFCVGIAMSGICIFGLLIAKGRTSFVEGRTKGIAVGRFEAAEAIEKEFGHYKGESAYQVLLSTTGRVTSYSGTVIKTNTVVCIETNGVKTVRVIP
jgi:hypothetical protein